jgi:Ca-activated chloride channel family protein
MRDRPLTPIGCLAVILITLSATVAQSLPDERPKLKHFGSSLDRLKWDDKKQAEVENRRAKPGESADVDVVRVETNLAVCNVEVRDKSGNIITDLTQSDFVVTEDDQPQRIEHFSLGSDQNVARTIVLIIDYSGSLSPYIKTSVEAAKMLVDQLGPKDIMAIVTDDVELLVDFTGDKNQLKERLDDLSRRVKWGHFGQSKQFSALMATVGEMFTAKDIRPIVIFQTDGDEVFDLQLSNRQVPRGAKRVNFNLRNLYETIEKSRVSVYTIIPGQRLIRARTEKELKKPAFSNNWDELLYWGNVAAAGAAIGGWASYLERPEQANSIYAKILADINSRFVIGYYPTNKAHDGKRRKVLVEVRGHPEYSVTGRKSYIAQAPN